ncbi:hypothetical protein BURPSS13_L0108 [Burkholderia pseudomallei S13]|nr:hypothetical protein BURPSS13_L0108 [Burkholderia pseudomallei S13]
MIQRNGGRRARLMLGTMMTGGAARCREPTGAFVRSRAMREGL